MLVLSIFRKSGHVLGAVDPSDQGLYSEKQFFSCMSTRLRPFVKDRPRGKSTYPGNTSILGRLKCWNVVTGKLAKALWAAQSVIILGCEAASGCQSTCSEVSQFIIVALALD